VPESFQLSYQKIDKALYRIGAGLIAIAHSLRPIPSNRDIDEVAFPGNRQMIAEQRKLPGEPKYPVVSECSSAEHDA
jgi:hypothetical protein